MLALPSPVRMFSRLPGARQYVFLTKYFPPLNIAKEVAGAI
jgi:hypothetical protein